MRWPSSRLVDSTFSPSFLLSAPLMNPRTVCFCQFIFSMISASVAPFFRWSMATTWAVLLPSRGPAFSFPVAGFLDALAAFFVVVAFFGAAAFGLPPLALSGPWARSSWRWHPSSRRPSPARRWRPVPQRWRLCRLFRRFQWSLSFLLLLR